MKTVRFDIFLIEIVSFVFFFTDIGQDNRDAIELKFELFFFPMMKSLITGDSFGKSFSC